ncbi:right-handed parallel beta-helix repeat-containing protein [Coraliomargarita sp. W4R72]
MDTVNSDLYLSEYGAVGDGKTDDIAALRAALDALAEAGPGATLHFEPGKVYKLGVREDSLYQIDLQKMEGVTVDGHGSLLLSDPKQAYIRIRRSTGVTVQNLRLESDPLSYTQGKIIAMNSEAGWFDIELMEGFHDMPSEEQLASVRPFWPWGAVLDPGERRIRPGMTDHVFTERFEKIGERKYRMFAKTNYHETIEQYRIGDVYFQPLYWNTVERLESLGRHVSYDAEANIIISQSADCVIKNVTMYSGRSAMTSRVEFNTGRITFDGFQVRHRPGFEDRVVTNWRDGMHCKDNRVGPVIENCYFEGLLDDSINIASDTIMAVEPLGGNTIRFCNWRGPLTWHRDITAVREGDQLMAYFPPDGVVKGPYTVLKMDPKEPQIMTLDQPIEGLVTGQVRAHVDVNATQFYNLNAVSRGFVVRNNTFDKQRRDAIRARGYDGLIEGNTVRNLAAEGIYLSNEMGSFYEGPFSQNVTIRNNHFSNMHGVILKLISKTGTQPLPLMNKIVVENNTFVSQVPTPVIVDNVANVRFRGNRYIDEAGNRLEAPIDAQQVSNLIVEDVPLSSMN